MNDCENCVRLQGQIGALEKANERLMEQHRDDAQTQQALMDQCVKFENQIAQMMTTLGDQTATIRRLTVERLGPEKSMIDQMKERGLMPDPAIIPKELVPYNAARIHRAFDTLVRAIEAEGYRVLIDPDGVHSIEKKTDTGLYELDPAFND